MHIYFYITITPNTYTIMPHPIFGVTWKVGSTPRYEKLGVERGGPVIAYIDPGLLFRPERSILRSLKLLGGFFGGIDQFLIKT